jgi:glycosyltransferase involved in cell wall biosynthesis
LLNFILKLRTTQIQKIIRNEHCDVIIACTGDIFNPPAAFSVSRDLGIPFILYTFDYYSCHWKDPFLRSFATRYEPDLVQGAAHVIVPNECMHEEYLKRYGIDAKIIHNPFDIWDYEKQAQNKSDNNNIRPNEKTIVYTGAIYDAHYSAFRNLITAIKSLENLNISIHLYTPQSQYRLAENNITGPVVVHEAQPVTAMPAIQRNADILFLPLSFGSQFPEVIKTSAPGKLGEYLASKRPILVHAPKNSFVSWYFRKYHCGLVIDEDNPKLLAQAIRCLINDKDFCKEITENAYLRAKTDFDVNTARKKFLVLFE